MATLDLILKLVNHVFLHNSSDRFRSVFQVCFIFKEVQKIAPEVLIQVTRPVEAPYFDVS
jgi:hypothetical protein